MNHSMVGDSTGDPGTDEDGALLCAARSDGDAFVVFYDRNVKRVLAYFYRRTFCAQTSAELSAETFAQAWTSLKRFDPELGTGRGWLFGIAGNLYKQWLRRGNVKDRARRQLRISTPELTEDDLQRIDDLVDTSELRAGLQQALGQLSSGIRDAVLLRVALDMPYDEVAAYCGCSIGAARVRVARGLSSLATIMDESR